MLVKDFLFFFAHRAAFRATAPDGSGGANSPKTLDIPSPVVYTGLLPVGGDIMLSLVVGLGNIGAAYAATRHNVGFEVVRRVAEGLRAKTQPSTIEYDWARASHGEQELLLALPRLLMNRSGIAVEALLQRNELTPTQMLVVLDDFNLPLGRLRFRSDGSDGGHNGLASIIETLESEDFPRLRLGIGPLPDNTDSADFVLSRFETEEIEPKEKMIVTAAEAVLFAIDHRLDEAMSKYNVNPA